MAISIPWGGDIFIFKVPFSNLDNPQLKEALLGPLKINFWGCEFKHALIENRCHSCKPLQEALDDILKFLVNGINIDIINYVGGPEGGLIGVAAARAGLRVKSVYRKLLERCKPSWSLCSKWESVCCLHGPPSRFMVEKGLSPFMHCPLAELTAIHTEQSGKTESLRRRLDSRSNFFDLHAPFGGTEMRPDSRNMFWDGQGWDSKGGGKMNEGWNRRGWTSNRKFAPQEKKEGEVTERQEGGKKLQALKGPSVQDRRMGEKPPNNRMKDDKGSIRPEVCRMQPSLSRVGRPEQPHSRAEKPSVPPCVGRPLPPFKGAPSGEEGFGKGPKTSAKKYKPPQRAASLGGESRDDDTFDPLLPRSLIQRGGDNAKQREGEPPPRKEQDERHPRDGDQDARGTRKDQMDDEENSSEIVFVEQAETTLSNRFDRLGRGLGVPRLSTLARASAKAFRRPAQRWNLEIQQAGGSPPHQGSLDF